ncbi:MAG: hypothetical protein KAR06_02395 [Deltaproteobacteria bacterium]|nr:hypothetical protein [Deltaproteobacteria bacterium]
MAVKKISESTSRQQMMDLLLRLLNMSFTKAGLTVGGTSTKIKIAVATMFCINGLAYKKAITDNITITAGAEQALATFCKYLVSLNAAGTVTTTKGDDAATAALALVPALPDDNAPVGYFQVETGGAITFTAGTTDLAGDVTVTYVDMNSVVTEK